MIEEHLIPITCMLLLLVLILVILYFYFKRQQKRFFNYIQDKDYKIVKNVETDIENYSKMEYKFVHKMADIIFLEDEIFILIHHKLILGGEILQVGKKTETFPGILRKLIYTSKSKVQERLELKGYFNRGILNYDFKIALYFKNKDFDINSVLHEIPVTI